MAMLDVVSMAVSFGVIRIHLKFRVTEPGTRILDEQKERLEPKDCSLGYAAVDCSVFRCEVANLDTKLTSSQEI